MKKRKNQSPEFKAKVALEATLDLCIFGAGGPNRWAQSVGPD